MDKLWTMMREQAAQYFGTEASSGPVKVPDNTVLVFRAPLDSAILKQHKPMHSRSHEAAPFPAQHAEAREA